MRSPTRIAPLFARLRRVWDANPDLRLGQMVVNAAAEPSIYSIEDDQLVSEIERVHPAPPAPSAGPAEPSVRKHSHYFKRSPGTLVDVYRVGRMFNVNDPALFHALKKILLPGERGGGKSVEKDIEEARDSLIRFLEMQAEDAAASEVAHG